MKYVPMPYSYMNIPLMTPAIQCLRNIMPFLLPIPQKIQNPKTILVRFYCAINNNIYISKHYSCQTMSCSHITLKVKTTDMWNFSILRISMIISAKPKCTCTAHYKQLLSSRSSLWINHENKLQEAMKSSRPTIMHTRTLKILLYAISWLVSNRFRLTSVERHNLAWCYLSMKNHISTKIIEKKQKCSRRTKW